MAFSIFVGIILLLSGFALYITRTEKRSFGSYVGERMLQLRLEKGIFKVPKDSDLFLQEKAVENEKPYRIIAPLKLLGEITYTRQADMECIFFRERSYATDKRIVFLHGGAYVEQPLLPHFLFLDAINNVIKSIITIPLYPLAPVHTCEESLEKLVTLYIEMLERHNPKKIILMGDSAGGGLSLALAQELLVRNIPQPKEIILISPWLDISLRNSDIDVLEKKDPMLIRSHLQQMGRSWAGSMSVHARQVSPINGPLVNLAPISLFVGTHEIFLADARKFVSLCQRNGVSINYYEYPKMNHDFPLYPIPEAKRAIREIISIIQS